MVNVKIKKNVSTLDYNLDCLCPIIISIPHSGTNYSKSFINKTILNKNELQYSEDSYVDDLLLETLKFNISFIKANFPRSYVDVNRHPFEINPSMISSHIPTFIYSNTKKARSGIGVIPRVSIYGNEIYDKLLSRKEVICRLLNNYFPYYKKLKFIIKSLKDKFNNILILDFHSMPSNSLRYNSDIILGNNYNLSCSKVLTSLIKEYFNSYNYKVLENYSYSGGYITKSLGKPEIGVNILQIEINRAIYMNEKTLFKHHHNMQLLSKNIKEIIINLGQNINKI